MIEPAGKPRIAASLADTSVWAIQPEIVAGLSSLEVSGRRADGGTDVLLALTDPSAEWPTPYLLKTPRRLARGTEVFVMARSKATMPGLMRVRLSQVLEASMTTLRSWGIGIAVVAALSSSLSAQWPAHPTPNVPRNRRRQTQPARARAAHTRRQAGSVRHLGEPGLAESRQRRQRDRWLTGHAGSVAARTGTLLRHRIGCARRSAISAFGRCAQEAAHGRQHEGQPRRALPADGQHAAAQPSAAAKDHPDTRPHRDPVRGQRRASGRSSPTAGRCPATIRSRGGLATPPASGKATRWSCDRAGSEMAGGSTSTAVR